MSRTGLLLLNVGTPDSPETPAVRRYLREFLGDPRVVDISALGRWLLLNLIVLPFRPAKSAEAYRKVWTPQGSPLMVHSLALRDALRTRLGDSYQIEIGMRYGNPSIASAFKAFQAAKVDRIVAAPLFPQYASSSTGTAVAELYRIAGEQWNVPTLATIPPFFAEPGYLDSFASVAKPHQDEFAPDYVLFSFHGLPERHMHKGDATGEHCLQAESCCQSVNQTNRLCYRAQCFETARQIARRMKLESDKWSVSFQSRLGRTPWIRPHTDIVLPELAARGLKRVLVLCPAFVADCLETLEEIAIRGREQFRSVGGEDLRLVPSLNSSPVWVEALAKLVERHSGFNQQSALTSLQVPA